MSIGELVSELQFSRCERSWYLRLRIVQEPRGKGTSAVGSRYEATASGDCNILRTIVSM
jgi:hypothetical protein